MLTAFLCFIAAVLLAGYYFERDKTAPVIIFFSGYSNPSMCGSDIYELSWQQGWNILLVELRAHGDSGGKCVTMGVSERYDCRTWAEWADSRYNGDTDIFFMGTSYGASMAMDASDLDMPKSVRGIIDDCGFTTPMAMCENNADEKLPHWLPFAVFKPFLIAGAYLYGGFNIYDADARRSLAATDIPLLIIHGDADTMAPVSMAYELYEACSSEKELYIVPGADHTQCYITDPEGYDSVITEFVDRYSENDD